MLRTEFNEKEKLWKGLDSKPLFRSDISIGQLILRDLQIHGSKCAQISDDSGVRISYNEMYTKTVRAAQNIRKLGYQVKEVFGFVASNHHHLAPVVFAAFCLGCPINTMDTSFRKVELTNMLNLTKPRLMFCDVEVYELVSECLHEIRNDAKVFTFGGQAGASESVENLFSETGTEMMFTPTAVDGPNDIAAIICSSGTTGFPKGVSLSHAALISGIGPISSDDVLLSFSTLYWVSGLFTLLLGTFSGATRIITQQRFSPELQLRLIERYKVTYAINATHQMVLLQKSEEIKAADLSSVKRLMVGGSAIPVDIALQLAKHLPNGNVIGGYGMSEAAGGISGKVTSPNDKDVAGPLASNVIVKIVDEDGKRCGIGIDGEICAKFIHRFLGYYGNQAATDEFIDEEGFLKTGDIGRFDENGNLHYVDRKKELLKYCNFQISPSEIETFLMSLPSISAACVVGIPDIVATDLAAAVLIRKENCEISEQEIFDAVANHFADFSKLRGGVYFVDSFPLTPSGKIIRRFVKQTAIKLFNEK